jgi:hypothetical protein
MKKLKFIFASFPTFAIAQEVEAKTKPKEHYLQSRLKRLQKLAQLARGDKNPAKTIQAHRLINELQMQLSNQTKINLPYIN